MWNIPGTPENADVYDKYQLLNLGCLGGPVSYTTGLKGKSTMSMYCDCVSEGLRGKDTLLLISFRPFSFIFFCILSLYSIFSSHISIQKCPFCLSGCFSSNSLSVSPSIFSFLMFSFSLFFFSSFYFSSIAVYPNKNLSGNRDCNVIAFYFLSK